MTNSQLKSKIEKHTGGTIKTSSYKCGNFEGYATLLKGGTHQSAAAYGHRTRAQAVKTALIRLATAMGLTELADACSNDNQRYNDADFLARTAR